MNGVALRWTTKALDGNICLSNGTLDWFTICGLFYIDPVWGADNENKGLII